MAGLETPDIRFVNRIIILMRTESLGLSILIATWELIKKKLTPLSKKFAFAPNVEIEESNTSSSMGK